MHKRRLSIVLMLLTITTIVVFQAYWLDKTFREEKKVFVIRTSALFRETLFRLQASRLHIDSGRMKIEDKDGIVTVSEMLTSTLKDSAVLPGNPSPGPHRFVTVSIDHKGPPAKDDSPGMLLFRKADDKVYRLLNALDSLQDPVPITQADSAYTSALKKEGIALPFRITLTTADTSTTASTSITATASKAGTAPATASMPATTSTRPDDPPDPSLEANKVRIGFAKPLFYQLEFTGNISWFILRRIGPQLFFSLLLVAVTVFSFTLLYRNWQQQRRLTQLKNDFIGNMTHELKTPIATVSVAVEALRHFNALQDPARTREYLDISAGELQRLSLLVDKVLKLSLFENEENEEIEVKKSRFDLKELVEEVVTSLRLQLEKAKASLTVTLQGSDFTLEADRLHITSVIFNLLDNALKYTPEHPLIQVGLSAEPESLSLSVTDNGVGIPEVYRDRVFEKFFRVPAGNRHNVKGYGLGLSYVSYVLLRHGGTIRVDSHEGSGSRFTVKIPREHV